MRSKSISFFLIEIIYRADYWYVIIIIECAHVVLYTEFYIQNCIIIIIIIIIIECTQAPFHITIQIPYVIEVYERCIHWQIDIISNLINFQRNIKAIQKIFSKKSNPNKLLLTIASAYINSPGIDNTSDLTLCHNTEFDLSDRILNKAQRLAVESSITNAITLVQGPPGTGTL